MNQNRPKAKSMTPGPISAEEACQVIGIKRADLDALINSGVITPHGWSSNQPIFDYAKLGDSIWELTKTFPELNPFLDARKAAPGNLTARCAISNNWPDIAPGLRVIAMLSKNTSQS